MCDAARLISSLCLRLLLCPLDGGGSLPYPTLWILSRVRLSISRLDLSLSLQVEMLRFDDDDANEGRGGHGEVEEGGARLERHNVQQVALASISEMHKRYVPTDGHVMRLGKDSINAPAPFLFPVCPSAAFLPPFLSPPLPVDKKGVFFFAI